MQPMPAALRDLGHLQRRCRNRAAGTSWRYLGPRERSVGDIVVGLRLAQPSVSKHLKVLHEVGLVDQRRDGRQVFYRTNAQAIRPLHEWTVQFERYWHNQLVRVKERAERESKRSEETRKPRRQP